MITLRKTLPVVALITSLLCNDTLAQKITPARGGEELLPRAGMRVCLDILVDGKPVRTISHKGKTYLPVATLGKEYEIRVSNHGPRRITAIVSVDGLSVISGKLASATDAGYLVEARGSIIIKGWRRNLNTVAAFGFVEPKKSYAARMGRPENVGVIGLVAFEELALRPRPWREKGILSSKAKNAKSGGVGTDYGRDVDSRVYYVPFVRSTNKRTITYYYDTVKALRDAGVPVDPPAPVPFPGDGEFAKPPPKDQRK